MALEDNSTIYDEFVKFYRDTLKSQLDILKSICYLLILFAGIVGNSLQIAISIRETRTRFSTRLYTALIAGFDSYVLLAFEIQYLWPLFRNTGKAYGLSNGAFVCYVHAVALYIAKNCSIWLLCVVSLERFLVVQYPIWGRANVKRWKTGLVVLFVVLVSILLNIILIFFKYVDIHGQCHIVLHLSQYAFYFNLVNITFFNVIPLIILTGTSIRMILFLKSKSQRRVIQDPGQVVLDPEYLVIAGSFKITIATSMYFVFSTLPLAIYLATLQIQYYFKHTENLTKYETIVTDELRYTLSALFITNFASRFFISLMSSKPVQAATKSLLKGKPNRIESL